MNATTTSGLRNMRINKIKGAGAGHILRSVRRVEGKLRMISALRVGIVSLVVGTILALSACKGNDTPPPPPATPKSPEDAPPTERIVGPLSEEDARAGNDE